MSFLNGGLQGIIPLNGSESLSGTMLLNQVFRGISFPFFSVCASFFTTNNAQGFTVALSPWNFATRNTHTVHDFACYGDCKNKASFQLSCCDILVRATQTYKLTGTLIMDTMYKLDGRSTLDGSKKLNANKMKEDL